jgi:hypothetical protein
MMFLDPTEAGQEAMLNILHKQGRNRTLQLWYGHATLLD